MNVLSFNDGTQVALFTSWPSPPADMLFIRWTCPHLHNKVTVWFVIHFQVPISYQIMIQKCTAFHCPSSGPPHSVSSVMCFMLFEICNLLTWFNFTRIYDLAYLKFEWYLTNLFFFFWQVYRTTNLNQWLLLRHLSSLSVIHVMHGILTSIILR